MRKNENKRIASAYVSDVSFPLDGKIYPAAKYNLWNFGYAVVAGGLAGAQWISSVVHADLFDETQRRFWMQTQALHEARERQLP